jgi:hypothetical protein
MGMFSRHKDHSYVTCSPLADLIADVHWYELKWILSFKVSAVTNQKL